MFRFRTVLEARFEACEQLQIIMVIVLKTTLYHSRLNFFLGQGLTKTMIFGVEH